MNILSAPEIKAWDEYTIQHEPVSSIDLMERAASKCTDWILSQKWNTPLFKIFCGKGNNGGDGLAIARMLLKHNYKVSVYILEFGKPGTTDFQMNLQRLHEMNFTAFHFIQSRDDFPVIEDHNILIDALFGSGLNKPLEQLSADLVDHMNHSGAAIISIDLPSGLFIDRSSKNHKVVRADHTLSFQCYKPGMLMQENASFIGQVHIMDIGLHPGYMNEIRSSDFFVTGAIIKNFFRPRPPFAHKGNFGHALMIAGSYGKMGAAVLSAKACLHSGVGLLTCYVPRCGFEIMQTSTPEAMVITDENEKLVAQLPGEIEKYTVIGIGPGIGTADETQNLLSFVIRRYQKPLVIDADGLNCLALQKELLQQLPGLSVITPHPKEFDRLFGSHDNDFDRLEKARQKAKELHIVIVLKSHHTAILLPEGGAFFNSTGNAGMAKGGSGDVLTGIITSLVAQGYGPSQASILGVYLHGLAGDFASAALSKEAMVASDISRFLPKAFLQLK